jgi:hypothetical protein
MNDIVRIRESELKTRVLQKLARPFLQYQFGPGSFLEIHQS